MSIVTTEVESVHGSIGQQRMIYYRCQDHLGVWHTYGPIITVDDSFDIDASKIIVAGKIAEALAEQEFAENVGS